MAETAGEMFCPFTKEQCRNDCALMDEATKITMDGITVDYSCAFMQISLNIASLVEVWPEDGEAE